MAREHRRERRQRTNLSGSIPSLGCECRVRDISDSGARLTFMASPSLPPRFLLLIGPADISRDCELKWQQGSEAGVRFRRMPER